MFSTSASMTTTALLEGLGDPVNAAVWGEFDGRYRPIILGFARRLGLSEDDSADVAQEVLTQFVQDFRAGKYDRTRGRLRSWIIGIARHRIADSRRRRFRRHEVRGDSALANLQDEEQLSRIWDEEARQAVLCRALELLSANTRSNPKSLEAFKLLVIAGRTPQEVAEELGMSAGAVHLAKHRCLARLRSIVADLSAAYEVE